MEIKLHAGHMFNESKSLLSDLIDRFDVRKTCAVFYYHIREVIDPADPDYTCAIVHVRRQRADVKPAGGRHKS